MATLSPIEVEVRVVERRLLDELGVFVHGALAFGHALGIAYNLKRRNWWDVAAHAAAGAYDLWAAGKHARDLR